MQVTNEMLIAAMKKAVSLGVFPETAASDDYLKNWDSLKAILQEALNAQQQ